MFGSLRMRAETFLPTNIVCGESDFTISVIPSGFRTFPVVTSSVRFGSFVDLWPVEETLDDLAQNLR